jgi:hypothetical protein
VRFRRTILAIGLVLFVSVPSYAAPKWLSRCGAVLVYIASLVQDGQSARATLPRSVRNRWSPPRVTNREASRSFRQEEVLVSSYPPEIRESIEEILQMSGDGWAATPGNQEVGFFALLLTDGSYVKSRPLTSHRYDQILQDDLDRDLGLLLESVDHSQIARVQFFHTHPRSPMARTISRGDVDEGLLLQKRFCAQNLRVPFDIHAIPP